MRKNRDAVQAHVDDLRKRLADSTSESWEIVTLELELDMVLKSLRSAQSKVTKMDASLGVDERNALRHLVNSPFLTKRLNARALKTRIRERLRSRKFELDRLERSYRKQRSGSFYGLLPQSSRF